MHSWNNFLLWEGEKRAFPVEYVDFYEGKSLCISNISNLGVAPDFIALLDNLGIKSHGISNGGPLGWLADGLGSRGCSGSSTTRLGSRRGALPLGIFGSVWRGCWRRRWFGNLHSRFPILSRYDFELILQVKEGFNRGVDLRFRRFVAFQVSNCRSCLEH